jgi:hypothetical protein
MAYNPYGGTDTLMRRVLPLKGRVDLQTSILTTFHLVPPYGPPPTYSPFPGAVGAPGMAPPGLGKRLKQRITCNHEMLTDLP